MQLSDFIKPKNWWRFIKKGISFALIVTTISWAIDWLVTTIGFAPLNSVMELKLLRGVNLIAAVIIAIVSYAIVGFVIEYLNEAKNKAIKWVNK